MFRSAVFIVFALSSLVCAFDRFPYQDQAFYGPQIVNVDCTSGSDSTGDGSIGNPFLTIAYAQTVPMTNYYMSIVVHNGPCNESQITLVDGFYYYGDGFTPVQITNGFKLVSSFSDYVPIRVFNFHLGALDADATNQGSMAITNQVVNCIVNSGTLVGSVDSLLTTVAFYGCNVSLTAVSDYAFVDFHDSYIATLPTIGIAASISVTGGTYATSTAVGDYGSVRVCGSDVSAASFSSTSTGSAIPLYAVGTSTKGTASVSGLTTVHYVDDYDQRITFVSVTLGPTGTATVTMKPVYGDYVVYPEPTASTTIHPYINNKTPTGFILHGDANATLNLAIIKRV